MHTHINIMEYHFRPHQISAAAWTRHFRAMASNDTGIKEMYRLKSKHVNEPKVDEKAKVELVTESQQVVEQAKSALKDEETPGTTPTPSFRPEPAPKVPAAKKGKSRPLKSVYSDDIFA